MRPLLKGGLSMPNNIFYTLQKSSYLDEKVQAYADSDCYPFHMPGHKRKPFGMLPGELRYHRDRRLRQPASAGGHPGQSPEGGRQTLWSGGKLLPRERQHLRDTERGELRAA